MSLKFKSLLFLGLFSMMQEISSAASPVLSPSVVSVLENTSATLSCTTDDGAQAVGWYRNNITVGTILLPSCRDFLAPPINSLLYTYSCQEDSNTWTIRTVTRINHEDFWLCTVLLSGQGFVSSNNATVSVIVLVSSVEMITSAKTEPSTVRENVTFTLQCRTSPATPEATVRWFKDNKTPVDFSDDIEITRGITSRSIIDKEQLITVQSTLQYAASRSDWRVRIYCTANNTDKVVPVVSEKKTMLNVEYPPEGPPIIQAGDSYNVTEGIEARLTCTVRGGNPPPVLTWQCFNASVSDLSEGDVVIKIATWTPVRRQDGSCTCQASHYSGSTSDSIGIKVIYAPDATIRPTSKDNVQNMPVTLFCDANGYPSTYTYKGFTQTYNGRLIRNPHRALIGTAANSSLYIPAAQLQDTGTYTCEVNNGIARTGTLDQEASFDLTVKVLPLFLQEVSPVFRNPGENLTVSVPLYSFPDIRNITVIRADGLKVTKSNNFELKTSSSVREASFYSTKVLLNVTNIQLVYTDLTNDDFQAYAVVAVNDVGQSSLRFSVSHKRQPSPPSRFEVFTSYEGVQFRWSKGSNGGTKQSFVVQTLREGDDIWRNQTIVQELNMDLTEENYMVNVTDLPDGVYRCRLVAFNSVGQAEAVYLPNTIKIITMPKRDDSGSEVNAALIVGLSMTAIILCLVGFIFYLAFKLRRMSKDNVSSTKLVKTKSEKKGYANVAYKAESSGQPDAAAVHLRPYLPTGEGHYTSLHDHYRGDTKAYDVIQTAH